MTSNADHRHLLYAFRGQGLAMLSSVLLAGSTRSSANRTLDSPMLHAVVSYSPARSRFVDLETALNRLRMYCSVLSWLSLSVLGPLRT